MLYLKKFIIDNQERIEYLVPIDKRQWIADIIARDKRIKRKSLFWFIPIYQTITKDVRDMDTICDELLTPIT